MSSSTLLHPAPTDRLARSVAAAARASARRPRLVILLWLALIAGCGIGGTLLGTVSLTDAASASGQAGQAERQLQSAGLLNRFDESVIITTGSASHTRRLTATLAEKVRHTAHVASVSTPSSTPSLSTHGGRTALMVVSLRGDPDHQSDAVQPLETLVTRFAQASPGASIGEAGDGSFTRAENDTISSGMSTAEMIAFPVTLVILIGAFGALVAALVPLLLGLSSVGAAIGALGFVSHLAPEGSTTSSVVILIGLAVGVDYSLFYIRREREERRAGAGPAAALNAAASSVGRAIIIAGATVVIGLIGLLFTGNGIFVSMGLGAIVVVAIAVLGSLTVLPATLALLGDRLDRGRLWRRRAGSARVGSARARSARAGSRTAVPVWTRLANSVTARPVLSFAVSLAVLALLAAPLLTMATANPESADLPPSNPTVLAQHRIDAAFPGGTDTADLVVSGHGLGRPAARATLRHLGELGQRRAGGAGGAVDVRVSSSGDVASVAIPVPSGNATVESHTVATLRALLEPATARALPGASALLGGSDAGDVDFNHKMAYTTPLVIGFVLALAFVLLVATFRSPVLAIAVIGLNLASVGAAFGVLTELFQAHWAGQLFHLRSFGAVVDWLPLFAFVVLFGLSMDYTILILERAREARRRGASARAAAAEALGATGSTVTSAALVMVSVFAAFISVPLVSFKEMGVGLAAAILIDATLVRAVALPAVLTLLGDRGLRPSREPTAVRSPRDPLPSPRPAWDHRGHVVVGDLSHD